MASCQRLGVLPWALTCGVPHSLVYATSSTSDHRNIVSIRRILTAFSTDNGEFENRLSTARRVLLNLGHSQLAIYLAAPSNFLEIYLGFCEGVVAEIDPSISVHGKGSTTKRLQYPRYSFCFCTIRGTSTAPQGTSPRSERFDHRGISTCLLHVLALPGF